MNFTITTSRKPSGLSPGIYFIYRDGPDPVGLMEKYSGVLRKDRHRWRVFKGFGSNAKFLREFFDNKDSVKMAPGDDFKTSGSIAALEALSASLSD